MGTEAVAGFTQDKSIVAPWQGFLRKPQFWIRGVQRSGHQALSGETLHQRKTSGGQFCSAPTGLSAREQVASPGAHGGERTLAKAGMTRFSIRVTTQAAGPLMQDSTVALFCCPDDFAKLFHDWQQHHLLPSDGQRRRAGTLSLGEMLFIMILFHLSSLQGFQPLLALWRGAGVPSLLCRASRLQQVCGLDAATPAALFLLFHCDRGQAAGIYCIDNTKLAVCHNARISGSRVFRGLAQRDRTAMGWFLGFKLHLLIHHQGRIMAVTGGQCRGRQLLERITAALRGQ